MWWADWDETLTDKTGQTTIEGRSRTLIKMPSVKSHSLTVPSAEQEKACNKTGIHHHIKLIIDRNILFHSSSDKNILGGTTLTKISKNHIFFRR